MALKSRGVHSATTAFSFVCPFCKASKPWLPPTTFSLGEGQRSQPYIRHLTSRHKILLTEDARCPYLDCQYDFGCFSDVRGRVSHLLSHMASTIDVVSLDVIPGIATHYQCPHDCGSISTSSFAMRYHADQTCHRNCAPRYNPISPFAWISSLVPSSLLEKTPPTIIPISSSPSYLSDAVEDDDDDDMILESQSGSNDDEEEEDEYYSSKEMMTYYHHHRRHRPMTSSSPERVAHTTPIFVHLSPLI